MGCEESGSEKSICMTEVSQREFSTEEISSDIQRNRNKWKRKNASSPRVVTLGCDLSVFVCCSTTWGGARLTPLIVLCHKCVSKRHFEDTLVNAYGYLQEVDSAWHWVAIFEFIRSQK